MTRNLPKTYNRTSSMLKNIPAIHSADEKALKHRNFLADDKRLHFLDSLRGIAALLVVLYHLYGQLAEGLGSILPSILIKIFSHGHIGVAIFFVLSGFVIGRNMAGTNVNGSYLGRFILRRSIRIDLPYWAAIFLALVLLIVKDKVLKINVTYPDSFELFVHMVYLQDYLSIHPLSAVFWTLCLEIQFYLLFALSMFFFRKLTIEAHSFFLAFTSIISLLVYCDFFHLKIPGLFLPYWFFFVIGVFVERALDGKGSAYFVFLLVAMIVGAIVKGGGASLITAIVISLIIYLVGLGHGLKSFLNVRPLQFLGAISYSLYLTHADVGWKAISVMQKIHPLNTAQQEIALIYLAIGVLVSILFAFIFYLLIERPSLLLAKKISLKSSSTY